MSNVLSFRAALALRTFRPRMGDEHARAMVELLEHEQGQLLGTVPLTQRGYRFDEARAALGELGYLPRANGGAR